jgi:L-ascorbate metabolism protein UlaG (beta-lactamase superfamily)
VNPRTTLAFAALLLATLAQERAVQSPTLELVYLANEGFLLRSGEHSLVIDAFVTEPYGNYAAVPSELFAALVDREPPFADLDLVLTSHVHPDHFQAEAAASFFAANPATPFLSSPQVVDELRKGRADSSAGEGFQALLPGEGERRSAPAGGIQVELLRLPHTGGARTAGVQNLGHLIDLGGVRVLHVGDADVEAQALATYELAKGAIDVALVPYWWLGDAQDLARVRERTGARHLVAVHVPPSEVAAEKAHLAMLDPSIVLFERAGEARTLTLAR